MIPALLHAFSKPTSENFHTLVRSEGVRVWDDKGNEYIDGLGGLRLVGDVTTSGPNRWIYAPLILVLWCPSDILIPRF